LAYALIRDLENKNVRNPEKEGGTLKMTVMIGKLYEILSVSCRRKC
jgi:hypothetical protein